MMSAPVFLVIVAAVTAAAMPHYEVPNEDFIINMDETTREDVVVPQKRAALVLDRLLVALQKALHDEAPRTEVDDGPRTAPLRYLDTDDMTGLQRRGQGVTRGRVLRCYFNAITCF